MNKKEEKPSDLKDFEEIIDLPDSDYTNVVGQDDLSRFDDVFKKKKKKKNKSKRKSTSKKGSPKD